MIGVNIAQAYSTGTRMYDEMKHVGKEQIGSKVREKREKIVPLIVVNTATYTSTKTRDIL